MNTIYDVLAFVGGGGALLVAAAVLIRAAMTHGMNRDLERFKSKLQSTSELQAERLRHERRLVAADLEKRSALLNEKRAEVVAELYKKLVDFLSAARSFAALAEWSGEPTKEEKAVTLADRTAEFFTYYQYHRIYFSEELCGQLKSLFEIVYRPALKLRVWMNYKGKGDKAVEKHDEAWNRAWDTIEEDVPPILTAVEREFRSLLGVTK